MKSKKVLAVLLAMLMLLSSVTVAFSVFASPVAAAAAEEQAEDVVYTREELLSISDKYGYDLSEDQIDAILSGEKTLSEIVGDKEEDTILIVQLSSKGALAQENETDPSSEKVEKAQKRLAEAQEVVQGRIARKVLDGADIDVMYSYTLLSNSFAMTGKPSQINEIAKIRGVESVYTAPIWTPVPTDAETNTAVENQAANYFTGSDNTTDKTGAGTVVAVIDTGLDCTYKFNATNKIMTTTFHKAFQNSVANPSLASSDISAKWTQTKAYSRIASLTDANVKTSIANSVYRSTKVPFAFNYGDDSMFVGHKYCNRADLNVWSNLSSSYGAFNYDFYWVDDEQGDHGTHVSGITAGYETDSEGKVVFEGVAPDAQIMVMKVFGKERAGNFADILAAMEDSVLLGADVINLSLGTWAGFTYGGDRPSYDAAFQAAADAGIVVCASAGNDYSAAKGTLYGTDEALTSNPDNGIVGSPASYDDNLAVASAASKDYYARVITVEGRGLAYTNNASDSERSIEKHFGTTQGYRILKDDNGNMLQGTPTDFDQYAASSKVEENYVVVRRGQTFTKTAALAEQYGAIGLIVCDNVDGSLVTMMENQDVKIPAIFISKADGDYLFSLESNPDATHKIVISSTTEYIVNPAAGTMNDFSSWGVTPDLKLKPEITGYGGNVYSTLKDNTYGLLSGTSMSSPYLAGVSALVLQNLGDALDADPVQKQQYAKAVMMSTAIPMLESSTGLLYSPRKQGAGLVNIDAALASKAYVTVDGSPTPKIDFGDDKAKSGIYDLTFNVVNTDSRDLTFEISSTVQTEAVDVQSVSYLSGRLDPDKAAAFKATGLQYNNKVYAERVNAVDELENVKFMSGLPYALDADVATSADANIVTVPAGSTVAVTVTVTLGSDAKAYMDANFENGIYVEGFITLTSQTEGQPNLGLPYMGFYGDWTKAPMLDEGTWEDNFLGNPVHPQMSVSTGNSVYWGSMLGNFGYPLGTPNSSGDFWPYDMYAEGATYIKDERNVFGGELSLNTNMIAANLGLLRSAKTINFKVSNADTGEVYSEGTREYVRKSFFYSESVGMINGGYFEDDIYKYDGSIEGTQSKIEPGTKVKYEVEVLPDYELPADFDNARNTFEFYAYYDGEEPKVENIRVYLDESSGDVMMDTEVSDEFFVGEISYAICGYTAAGVEDHVYMHTMLIPEYRGQHMSETLNLSEWARSGKLVQMRSIRVNVEDFCQKEGSNPNQCLSNTYKGDHYISFMDHVKVSCDTNVLALGSTATLNTSFAWGERILGGEWLNGKISANNEDYGFEEDFLFESSDPSVLKISAEGRLIPVAPGYATVSATGRYGKSTDSLLIRVLDDEVQALVEATPAGGVLNYNGDDFSGCSLFIDKDITIDLNGKTLTGADGYPAIRVIGGNVTIKNGTVNSVFASNSNKAVLVNILEDQAPALKIEGGNVTIENLNLNGSTYNYNGDDIIGGSAVTMEGNGSLTVKNSAMTGIYGINNSNSTGTVTAVSGNFEGVLGSISNMKNVVKGEGSEFIDVTNTLAEDTLSYLGTIEGGSIDYYQPASSFFISAEQLAQATPSTGGSIRYDAEKGCAVYTLNADKKFRKFDTQYLKIPVDGLDTSEFSHCVVSSGGSIAELAAQSMIGLSATASCVRGSGGVIPWKGTEGLTVPVNTPKDITTCTKYYNQGVINNLYFWPNYCSWSESSFTGHSDRPKYGDMEIYGIWFYKTYNDAAAFSTGTSSTYTNNLKVAGAQAYNTQFVIDGTTLNVSTSFPDTSDGSYKWAANELMLYSRVSNGDNTFSDTFVESKPITPDANGDVSVSFEGIDPTKSYVVKCSFDLSLVGENKSNFFHISESAASGLVKAFPDLINDMLLVDQLESAVVDLLKFIIYSDGMREGFVLRDARHYDCPLTSSKIKNYPYYAEYPDIIPAGADDFPLWLTYWEQKTFRNFFGWYNTEKDYSQPYPWPEIQVYYANALLFAKILGDEKMAEIYSELPNQYSASVLNAIDADSLAAHYGMTGTIPAFRAQLAALRNAATGETAQEQLSNALTYLANNFLPLYSSILSVITSVYDENGGSGSYTGATQNDTLINFIRGQDLANYFSYGKYNDYRDQFVEKIDACYEANINVQNAKNGLLSAMNGSLYAAIAAYGEDGDDLMDLYYGNNPIENGVFDLGVTATYEAEANYDGFITYELNGGVNNDANPIGYQRALPVVFFEPTKEGYTFGGWYTTADFQEGTEITGTDASTTGDIIIYAKWNINSYLMKFMLGEDVIDTVSYAFGEQTAATDKLNIATGLTFKYWYEDDSSKAYTFDTMPARDVILKAQLGYMSLDDFNKDGDTYVWPKDDHASLRLTVDRDCTIDFGGKVVTNMNDLAILTVENGKTVTIKNAIFEPADYLGTSNENYSLFITGGAKVTLENCVIKGAVTRTADGAYASCSAVKINNGSLKVINCVLTGLYAVDNTKGSFVTATPSVEYTSGVYVGQVRAFASNTNLVMNGGRAVDVSAAVADAGASDAYANRVVIVEPNVFNVNTFDFEYLPDTDEVQINLQDGAGLTLPDGSVFSYTATAAGFDDTISPIVNGSVTLGDFAVGTHTMKANYSVAVNLSDATAAFIYDLDDALAAASKAEITAFDALLPKYDNIITKWNNNKDKITQRFAQYADNALIKGYIDELRKAVDNINGTGSRVGILPQLEEKLNAYKALTTNADKLAWLLANKADVIALTVSLSENTDVIADNCLYLNALAETLFGSDYSDKLAQVYEIRDLVADLRLNAERLPSVAAADYASASDKDAYVAALLNGSSAFAGEKKVNGLVDLGDNVTFTRFIDPTNESFSAPTKFTVLVNSKLSDIVIPEEFPRITWKEPNTQLKETGTFPVAAIYTPTDTVKYNTVEFTIDVEVITPATYCERNGHSYGELIVVEATCGNGGNATRVCSMCGNVKTEEEFTALGHIDADNNNICDRCKEYITDTGKERVNWWLGFLNFFSTLFRSILKLFSSRSGNTASSGIANSGRSIFSYDSILVRLIRAITKKG